MKHKLVTITLAGATLVAAAASLQGSAFSFTGIGQTYTENFNNYLGSAATLPNHMFVEWDTSRSGMSGPDSPYTGVNDGAFTAYTSDSADYSFGIREREPVDLRDARLFFEFTNNTGAPLSQFMVSYDVEAWFIGDRRNRLRLKYDDLLDSPDRATFETDIFSTDNPSTTMTANTSVDGSLAANRTTVSGMVDITTIDDGTGNFFEPIADGETAWFRWQFSNADGDGGALRSGLAINNLSIQAIPEPSTYAALFGVGVLALALYRRRAAR